MGSDQRVDLDAVQVRYDAAVWFNAAGPPETMRTVLASVQDVPGLVAELRELREQRDDLARRLADMAIRYANLRADQAGEP